MYAKADIHLLRNLAVTEVVRAMEVAIFVSPARLALG